MNPIALLLAISLATILTVPLWGEPYEGKVTVVDDREVND
jgi:hypothetical protein